MNISIPDTLRDWVDEKVGGGSYATASDYVRDLVRRDREHSLKLARLRELIEEGERSGVSERSIDEIFDDVIARGRARHAQKAARG